MTILGLIVILMILGVVVYVLNSVLPMDARFKLIVNAVIIVAVLLWIADALGLFHFGQLGTRRIG